MAMAQEVVSVSLLQPTKNDNLERLFDFIKKTTDIIYNYFFFVPGAFT
jgi:hypothetical protein